MEVKIEIVCKLIIDYWRDLLNFAEDIVIDNMLIGSTDRIEEDALRVAVMSLTPTDMFYIVNECDENLKLYYMLRVWYRYLDIVNGNTFIDNDSLILTANSSIHELSITIETAKTLHQKGIDTIRDATSNLSELDYSLVVDIYSALSLLERRLPYVSSAQ